MKKLSLIFSDIELGSGTATDDFVEDDLLCDTIKENFKHTKEHPTDLILNGDIFDFLKCPYKGEYPRHITEKISVWKINKIHEAHPKVFNIWERFLESDKRTRIIFITGNHDFDVEYPEVQKRIKELITKNKKLRDRILFPGLEYSENLLYVEHGSQLDKFFKIDRKKLINYQKNNVIGEPYLIFPWGYNAIFDHFIHMKEKIPILERIHPKTIALSLLPLKYKWKMFAGTSWYMIKSFFFTQLIHWDDPLYRFRPDELYKYFYSFFKKEFTHVIVGPAKRKIKRSSYRAIAIGHSHQSVVKKKKGKLIINTGNWRDEYSFALDGKRFLPKQKSYGFILHDKYNIKLKLIKVASRQPELTIKELREILKS